MSESFSCGALKGEINRKEKVNFSLDSAFTCGMVFPLTYIMSKSNTMLLIAYLKIRGGARGARRWPWCNGYRRRKWTRQLEFKSWTRLIAFHIGKGMNPIILPPAMGK